MPTTTQVNPNTIASYGRYSPTDVLNADFNNVRALPTRMTPINEFGQNNTVTPTINMDSVGPYWAEANAQYELTNPTHLARLGRAINPITAFGSDVGMMHTAASNGDFTGIGLSAVSALPIPFLPETRAVVRPFLKEPAVIARTGNVLANHALNAEKSAQIDKYNPSY